jgi:hypothetical protein
VNNPAGVDLRISEFWRAADVFLGTLQAQGLWLIGPPKDRVVQAGWDMLRALEALNVAYADTKYFHLTPKAHAVVHIVLEAEQKPFLINPWLDCCWMDEDFIGRVCRKMVRQMDPRSVLTEGVERYLALMRTELAILKRA